MVHQNVTFIWLNSCVVIPQYFVQLCKKKLVNLKKHFFWESSFSQLQFRKLKYQELNLVYLKHGINHLTSARGLSGLELKTTDIYRLTSIHYVLFIISKKKRERERDHDVFFSNLKQNSVACAETERKPQVCQYEPAQRKLGR